MSVCLCPQDPAVATSKRAGNMPYESYDRGTEKNAWVTESDGKTPLLGEVNVIWLLKYNGYIMGGPHSDTMWILCDSQNIFNSQAATDINIKNKSLKWAGAFTDPFLLTVILNPRLMISYMCCH